MDQLYNKALKLGASNFGYSNNKSKRFYVIYNNKIINFGSNTNNTFIDHGNKQIRQAWRARHSKIINKDGIPFYKLKESPEFWAYNLLW